MAATDVDQVKTWISEVPAQAVALDRAVAEPVEETETPTLDLAGALVGEMCGWTLGRLASRLAPPADPADVGHVAAG